jgi:flagellar operon protein
MSKGTFLYPNVTSVPSQAPPGEGAGRIEKRDGLPSEFDRAFDEAISNTKEKPNLNELKVPLKFSAHASQRLKDRKIAFDPMTMNKINDAVEKAGLKGVEDTLILTPDAALIVNVSNRTVVTAMDRKTVQGNVFTNIDGAVIV